MLHSGSLIVALYGHGVTSDGEETLVLARREFWLVFGALHTGAGPVRSCPQGHGPEVCCIRRDAWTNTHHVKHMSET